jgi:serine/threonine protein kinase
MAWRLLVIDGADWGRAYPLPVSGPLTIGNGQGDADVGLHDLYVTRLHCRIVVDGGRIEVADQGSPQGTLVNGRKVERQEIHAGDVLRVGNSHLRLEEGEAEPVPASAGVPADPDPPGPDAPDPADPPGPPQLPPDRLEELTGHTLGHFQIGPVLGRGHYGLVFQARYQGPRRAPAGTGHVALKVLSPLFPQGGEEMRTFARVLKDMLALRHPNLVAVLLAGKTGPYCWIARELVEGDSLTAAIDPGGKPNWKRALRVAVHIARALDYACRRRLVHGNVTPQNILYSDGLKVAKLADLLLSTALEGSRLQLSVLEGKLLAELPYLAPEQTPGEAAVVDICTDIHGLGAVVYGLLTGRPPFHADDPADVLEQIRTRVPVRPRELSSDPGIPEPFEVIVLRMLAKRPEDRFSTPAELLAELVPLAQNLGVKV